jgi:hypothetical protein
MWELNLRRRYWRLVRRIWPTAYWRHWAEMDGESIHARIMAVVITGRCCEGLPGGCGAVWEAL